MPLLTWRQVEAHSGRGHAAPGPRFRLVLRWRHALGTESGASCTAANLPMRWRRRNGG